MCEHLSFMSAVSVNRIVDKTGIAKAFRCDVRVKCSECGQEFEFIHPVVDNPVGQASVTLGGNVLQCFIRPPDSQYTITVPKSQE